MFSLNVFSADEKKDCRSVLCHINNFSAACESTNLRCASVFIICALIVIINGVGTLALISEPLDHMVGVREFVGSLTKCWWFSPGAQFPPFLNWPP